MEWKSIKDHGYPIRDRGVLTYSEIYGDAAIYKIIDAQFVKICTAITHWMYLEKPGA